MYLKCQTLSGRFVKYVAFERRMYVNDLKKEIAASFGTESCRLLLFFNNQYLDANYSLARFNIKANDEIEVMIKPRALTMNRLRWIGKVPGIDVGRTFSRDELFDKGLHRIKQRGIYANPGNRAYSIVLSDKFDGDKDFGDVIVYCGERSQDPNQITMPNNTRALARTCNVELCEDGSSTFSDAWQGGYPVRVYKQIHHTTSMYYYAGIYKVVGYWLTTVNRHNTWKFRLIRVPDHEETLYEPYN